MNVDERLRAVKDALASACEDAGRETSEVTLVAVSKVHSADAIRQAYAAGQRVFGESYAGELAGKAEELADLEDIEWRMVGHLQRNKAKLIVRCVRAVDSVDSARLADALGKRASAMARTLEVLIQVNVAGETQKSGVTLEKLPALVDHVRGIDALVLRGLMTIPAFEGDPRQSFATLREAAERHELPELSMGMSGDMAVAVAEGATMVRVGTAIFGARA